MKPGQVIYRGAEALDNAICILYNKRMGINSISDQLGIPGSYVRSILYSRGLYRAKRPEITEKLEVLRKLLVENLSEEELCRRTGYSPLTIRMYRQWLQPETYCPRQLKEKPEEPVQVAPAVVIKAKELWPCRVAKSEWKVCFQKSHCQCGLNRQCGVSDGSRT